MIKLKKILSTMVIAIILLTNTGIYVSADSSNESISTQSYQLAEINENIYKQIRKLEDEKTVIEYYRTYMETQNSQDYINYSSAAAYYKATYGEMILNTSQTRLEEVELKIKELMPTYTSNWTTLINNKINIDLTKFTGIKYFVVWVRTVMQNGETTYKAHIYKLTGTGTAENIISISNINKNGTGTIAISEYIKNYRLYYQWIGIDEYVYNRVRQLQDELTVIQYYKAYMSTQDEPDYINYSSASAYYEATYGEKVLDASDSRVQEIMNEIESLLPNYTEQWTETSDNTYYMDLSQFSGNKYFVLWTLLEQEDGSKMYQPKIFKIKGTKIEEESNVDEIKDDNNQEEQQEPNGNDNNNNNNQEEQQKPNVDENNNNNNQEEQQKPNVNENKDDNNKEEKTENTEKKDNTTKLESTDNKANQVDTKKTETDNTTIKTTTGKNDDTISTSKIPYTGTVRTTTLISIIALSVVSYISFRKYKKIK